MEPIFSPTGGVVGWRRDSNLFSAQTMSWVGFTRDDAVFDSQCHHVGWMRSGWFTDTQMRAVAYHRDANYFPAVTPPTPSTPPTPPTHPQPLQRLRLLQRHLLPRPQAAVGRRFPGKLGSRAKARQATPQPRRPRMTSPQSPAVPVERPACDVLIRDSEARV